MYPKRWLIIWIIIYCNILINFSANEINNESITKNLGVNNISTTLDDVNNVNFQTTNSTNSTETYKYLYNNLKHYFLTWYLPTVIILGVVGTVFCLVFLFLSRLFPQNMLIWLVSICFGDFFILSLEGIWMLLKVWYNYDIRDNNNFICVLHTSLSNYFFYWSAYMQSMLSMQRAYSIIRPLRARNSGPKIIWLFRLWFLISICLILPILPYPLYWRVINGDCDPTNTDLYHVTTLNDFIVWGLIPLIGMTSSTVIICWNIFRLRKCFREATSSFCLHENEQKRKSSASRVSRLIYYLRTDDISENFRKRSNSLSVSESALNLQMKSQCEILPRIYKPISVHNLIDHTSRCNSKFHSQVIIRPTNVLNTRRTFATKSKAISFDQITNCVRPISNSGHRHGATDNVGHVTRLLVCMNIWYMASTYPLIIYLMLLNFVLTNVDRDVHKFMYYLSRSLCFLNACSNWIFYCASGRLFRSRIHQMVLRFMCRIRFCHRSGNSVRIPPDYTNHFKNQFVLNTSKNVYHSRIGPFFKYFSESRKNNMGLNKNHGGNKTNDMMHQSIEFIDEFGGHVLNSSFETVKKQNTDISSTTRDINFMHNTSGNYSNSCFPLGYQCFCNLFPCSLKVFSKPTDSNKNLSVKPYPNVKKLQKDGNGNEKKHVLLGCNGCFTGFCCWRFWWYGLMAGCIKRIPNTIETVTDSDQNYSVQVLTGISTSSSVYDSCDLHRRHSEFALNNLNYKYCTHYRSTEKFRELEPKRKLELDLAIQNTFSTQINQKPYEIANSFPSSRSFATPNNATRSIIDKDKAIVDYNHSDITLPKQIIPRCFCYMSSQGNRKFNYNLCQYHQDFNSSCRHHHSHQHFWPPQSSYLTYQLNRPNTSINSYRKNCQLPSSSNFTFSDVEVNSST